MAAASLLPGQEPGSSSSPAGAIPPPGIGTASLRRLLLILAIAAGVLIGWLGHGLRQTTASFQLDGERHHAATWLLMQTEMELRHFADTLARAAFAEDGGQWATLPAHLSGLRERLRELAAVDTGLDNPGLENLHDALPGILATFREVEAALRAQPVAPGTLLPLIAGLEQPVRTAMLRLQGQQHAHSRGAMVALADRLVLFALGFMVLLAASAALMAMLILAGRRTRRALEQARLAEGEARTAHATLRALVDNVPAVIATFDTQLRFVYANRSAQEFLGLDERALIGRAPRLPGLPDELEAELRTVRDSGLPSAVTERQRIDSAGQPRHLLVSTVPLFDAAGDLHQILRTGIDVTQCRQAEERIRHLTEHDALTDLPNRLRFKTELEARLAAPRAPGQALHVIDLDGFRSVNDTHGQAMGDLLLQAVVRRLGGLIRPTDMLARLGGDEFAVLQRIHGEGEALALAARITQALAQPYQLGPTHIRCSASLGLCARLSGEANAETMLARADLALANARREGIGRFKAFRPEMEGEALVRRQLQADLIEALAAGSLHLAYQPKFTLRDGRLEGVEALLRWNHPVRGNVSPGEFVPLAEEAGLAMPLARFVLTRAAAQVKTWQAMGLELPVAVNLSGELIGMNEALRMVENVLRETDMPAHLLEIEVTESTFIGDSEAARDMLLGLRRLGIRVALDDFGTGFSSLAYLQKLPIDVLKVDRCFVAGLAAGGASGRIVDTVVRLAHGLGARVVAEGVETQAQLEALRKLGCDSVQGFLLGRPQPADDITALLQRTQTRETMAIPA